MAFRSQKSSRSSGSSRGYSSGGRRAAQGKSRGAGKSSAGKRSTGSVKAPAPQTVRIEIIQTDANAASRPGVNVSVKQPRRAQF